MTEIFKITKDEKRAKALTELARKRYLSMNELKEPYRQIEEYQKIIDELISAFMYRSGETAKSIKVLTPSEIQIINDLNIEQNKISSSGEITPGFLTARKSVICWIIEKLLKT